MACRAARICLAWLRFQPALLDPDLMPPGDVQVVLVCEPGVAPQFQRRQRHVRRGPRQLPRSVAPGTKAELIKMDAFPPHHDLNDAVQLAQGADVRHQQAPPYHWTDAE